MGAVRSLQAHGFARCPRQSTRPRHCRVSEYRGGSGQSSGSTAPRGRCGSPSGASRAAGRQVKRRIGPAWTGRGRPPAGLFTKRTADTWLRDELRDLDALAAGGRAGCDVRAGRARSGCAPASTTGRSSRRRGATTARASRPSCCPRSASGARATSRRPTPERFRSSLRVSARTKNKVLVEPYGIFRRAQKVHGRRDVHRQPARSGSSPDSPWARWPARSHPASARPW